MPTRQGDPPCASLGGTRAGSPGIWDSVTARALLRPGSAGAGRCRGPLPRVRVEAGARAVYSALPPAASFEPRCPVCLLEPQDQHPGTSVHPFTVLPSGPPDDAGAAGVRLHGAPSSRPHPRAPHGSSTKWTTTPPFYRWRALKKKKNTGKCRETKAEKTAHGTPTSQPSLVLRTSPTRPTRLS